MVHINNKKVTELLSLTSPLSSTLDCNKIGWLQSFFKAEMQVKWRAESLAVKHWLIKRDDNSLLYKATCSAVGWQNSTSSADSQINYNSNEKIVINKLEIHI